ncbi:MAG: Beta-galactosidase C-terminal domain, partial [Blautia sp.]
VSVTVRENEDTEYLFIQNYARKPQAVPVPAEYELLYGTESEVMAPLQTRILKKSK